MTGTLSLSIELELGWGSIMKPVGRRFEQFSSNERKAETNALRQLLRTCENTKIPISFNIVGHLFQRQCNHSDAPHDKGWFDIDPNTNLETDPLFYAPDLINYINTSEINHEICSHTFSHIPVDEVKKEVLDWELKQAFKEHQAAGLPKPTTLITPYNRLPPKEVLINNGITAIREPHIDKLSFSKPRKVVWYLMRHPPTKPPAIINGITHIYCSIGISLASYTLPQGSRLPHPVFRLIPQKARIYAHRRYLRSALEAVCNGKHVHLWCHIYDLSNSIQLEIVLRFLREVGEYSNDNNIEVRTIKEIDNELRS